MESTIDDCFTISDNAGILEEKRLTGYNRDDIMFFVDGSLAQLVEHLTFNQGVRDSNSRGRTKKHQTNFCPVLFCCVIQDSQGNTA